MTMPVTQSPETEYSIAALEEGNMVDVSERIAPHLPYREEYEGCIVANAGKPVSDDPRDWPIEDRPWIYVASYYTACPSQGVANAAKYAAMLTEAGWNAFVPHFSLLYDMLMPMPPDYWYSYDLGLLARMDALFVCPDPLTANSKGVMLIEVPFAAKHDIPIFYEVVEAKERYSR